MKTTRHARAWRPLAAACLALATPCSRAEDLLTAYHEAAAQDPVFSAARHALEAAAQRVPQARAALLPVLGLNGNSDRQKGTATFDGITDVARTVRSSGWTLQLVQPLFRADRWQALAVAHAQLRQAGEQFRLAEQELILRVAQAYFDVLLAEAGLDVAAKQAGAVKQQLALATRNFEVGTSTVTDVHEAQSRFDLARSQAVSAANELEGRRAELEKILGMNPTALAGLRLDAPLPRPQPEDAQAWMGLAQAQGPQVGIQQAALDAAEREIARNRADHLPTLDLSASRNGSFSSGTLASPADLSTRSRSTQVGLRLTVPLYAGGGVDARVAEAIAARDKAADELTAARRQAGALARQAYSGVVSGQAQVEALASAVASSRSAVDDNRIGYRIGTRINIDVLNAEQQFYAAQRDLFKARVDTLMQGLRLKAAAGTLQGADVESLNTLLQPEGTPPG